MSHLSDVQDFATGKLKDIKLSFVKYLLFIYSDTNTEVDAEKEFEAFERANPHLF